VVKDYKKSGSKPKRQNRKVAPKKSGPPGWLWFVAGLVVAGFVFFLVYLAGQEPAGTGQPSEPTASPHRSSGEDVRDVKKADPEPAQEPAAKPRYEFYKILPETEVEVAEPEPAPRQPAEPAPQSAESSTAAPAPQSSADKEGVRYLLQAGSFQTHKDADRRKAELAMLGFEPIIQTVEVDGKTWHRVRIGPFTSRRKLNQTRDRLLDGGIQAMILQAK